MKRQFYFRYVVYVCVAALWSTLCFIVPDFIDSPVGDWRGICMVGMYVVALGIGHFLLLYACSSYKILALIFYPLFAVLGAVVSFYRVALHVTITPSILEVCLHTNWEEAVGVISWKLLIWVAFNLLCAIGLIWYRWRKVHLTHAWIHFLVAVVLCGVFTNCNGRLTRSIQQRYPVVLLHAVVQYAQSYSEGLKARYTPSFTMHTIPQEIDIVFVLGESVRADHMQLNGYNRPTNPLLMRREHVISFSHVYTPYTHTLASVPDILTRSDSAHYDRCRTETSFIPIFKECGFNTYWISNQDLGGAFTYFPNECDSAVFINAGKTDYVFHPWLDEDLLPSLHQYTCFGNARNVFILHTIGSHWYYNNHVPQSFLHFQPITDNRLVTDNTSEQIINSYDNTILYMDWLLDSIAEMFSQRCAIVFYLADHSESLGEEGRWLHATDAQEQRYPSCLVWYSDKYESLFPDKVSAIKENHTKNYCTDFLFYSILSSAGIEAEGYCQEKDITRESVSKILPESQPD